MPTLRLPPTIAIFIAVWCLASVTNAAAQDTREAVIAAQEAQKAAHPPPETKTKSEAILDWVSQFLQPKPRGFFPYFDSVYGGGGATLGAGYGMAYGDQANFLVRGLYSVKNYKLIEAMTLSPGHLGGRLQLTATAGWRNATDAAFYGLGMTTTLDRKTDFDLRESYASGKASLRPFRWMVLDGSVGVEAYLIGPAGRGEPSTETTRTPSQAPGLGVDPTYVHSSGTAAIDWRTSPGYTRKGGYYGATLHNYTNTNGTLDFNRLDTEVVQHVPVLRETWVLSFRGVGQTTLGNDNSTPYFLLPALGSGSTLRGYRSWRYRDRHSLLTQAEFRWVPNRLAFDMAVFYDAGMVAARRQDLRLSGMVHDWGIGLRLHGPAATPVRIEVARGAEGTNVIFSGSAAF